MQEPILVAIDFSELSLSALSYAVGLASDRGTRIDAVYVASDMGPTAALTDEDAHEALQDSQRSEVHDARRELETLMTTVVPLENRGRSFVLPGSPAQVICQLAGQGYELVVVATHGRTGLTQLLLGSVAERVVRHAPIPVLVIR